MSLGWNFRSNATQERTQEEVISAVRAACKETGRVKIRMHHGAVIVADFESALHAVISGNAKLEP